MRPLPLLATLVTAALLACSSDSVGPGPGQLVGDWRSPTQPLRPNGTLEGLFIVGADATTENHVMTRGVYPNQASDDLSTHEVLYGRIGISEDKFVIHPDSLVTTDVFYGPTYRHVQRDFNGWPLDSTQYQVRGSELQLEYYTYPADAPVLTRRVLYRVPRGAVSLSDEPVSGGHRTSSRTLAPASDWPAAYARSARRQHLELRSR